MKQVIGKINPKEKNVHIWGAGFSGLVLGYYLKREGFKVSIYETSDKIGGKIGTNKTFAGPVELGANAFYMNDDALELFKELQLIPIPATKKLKKLLLIDGKIRKPLHPSIISKVFLNLHKRPPLNTEGLTVADFFKPLIGKENVDKYISPALGGVYAAPSDKLHFKSVFNNLDEVAQFNTYWQFLKIIAKKMKKKNQLEVNGSVSFEGGMQTLINKLGEKLKHEIKLNYKGPFALKNNTIICTDAKTASSLLSGIKPVLSNELNRISYQPLSSTTVFIKREIRSLHRSFGVLLPFENTLHSIGVLNNKAIFPTNNENINSYTFISQKKCTKEEILADVKYLQNDFLPEDIDHMESSYWENALPIYDLQRYLSVKKLHQIIKDDLGIAIFGNYVAGISLREILTAAKNFAKYSSTQNSNL
jgi:oxygen-dependent protoporphyrinogen oxidase